MRWRLFRGQGRLLWGDYFLRWDLKEEASCLEVWGRTITVQRDNVCKVPASGMSLACSRKEGRPGCHDQRRLPWGGRQPDLCRPWLKKKIFQNWWQVTESVNHGHGIILFLSWKEHWLLNGEQIERRLVCLETGSTYRSRDEGCKGLGLDQITDSGSRKQWADARYIWEIKIKGLSNGLRRTNDPLLIFDDLFIEKVTYS